MTDTHGLLLTIHDSVFPEQPVEMSDNDASSHHSELQPISSESSSTRNPSPRLEKPDETEKASEKKNLLQFMRNKIFPTKVHVPEPFSFTKEARRPLTRFMDLVGLHEG